MAVQCSKGRAKSEAGAIQWALRRLTILEDAEGMVTMESIRAYSTQHAFEDLEKALALVNADALWAQGDAKVKKSFPYKTSNGQAAFKAFLVAIGCVWSDGVNRGGAVVTQPQRILYRGRLLMLDRATEKVYVGQFADDDSRLFSPHECVGRWRVPAAVRSKWKPDDIIPMTRDVGAWEGVRSVRLTE